MSTERTKQRDVRLCESKKQEDVLLASFYVREIEAK